VEERLLELQRQKRDLAAAIFSDTSALSGRLTREDLQQLLDIN
jgi:SNF2 family DNA or RNA helicase